MRYRETRREYENVFRPLTAREERAIDDNSRNTEEAHILLSLIAAEFETDPLSVQCFDARTVERVKLCAAKRRAFTEKGPLLY